MIYVAALPRSHGFVLALLLSVLLNNIFFVLMRAPTPRGVAILQQLAGFSRNSWYALSRDRPGSGKYAGNSGAALMDRFLPYAIALNVREGWGDKMASGIFPMQLWRGSRSGFSGTKIALLIW